MSDRPGNHTRRRPWISALALGGLALAATNTTRAASYTVLYSFAGGAQGDVPYAGLIRDWAGNFYGTTHYGGGRSRKCEDIMPGCGVVFKLDSAGNFTVLHSFTGAPDGGNPFAGVIRDSAGNLYGTTLNGGAYNAGVVYRRDSDGNFSILHSFTFGADGAEPVGGLIRDSEGNLYGTTELGGTGCAAGIGCGVVFKIDPAGKLTVLHDFNGGTTDGETATAGVIRDSAGNLYGTTESGGDGAGCGKFHCGIVYKLDPAGNFTLLHSFEATGGGANPYAGVIRDSAGNLYGTTMKGGVGCPSYGGSGCGVVYKLDPAGNFTVPYSFTGGRDGKTPNAIIRDSAGNLYGTTQFGGGSTGCPQPQEGCGIVFKLDPAGEFAVLHTFTGGADGAEPFAGLIVSGGYLYGTTQYGGASDNGVVFQIGLP